MLETHVYFCTCTRIRLEQCKYMVHAFTVRYSYFLSYHTVGQNLVAMTYGGPVCMYVSTCLHMHVCMCVPAMSPVFAWTGFESLFAYSCVYQIYNMVLCTDCQVQRYSILIVL
jgi:hypothetical protein